MAPELNGLTTFTINPYLHLFASKKHDFEAQFQGLIEFIKQKRIDLIHFHNTNGFDVAILERVKSTLKIPVVLTLHSPLGKDWRGAITPIPSADLVDAYVCISDFVHEKSITLVEHQTAKFHLIRNGVPLPEISSSLDHIDFIFCGRFSSEKGIAQLLSAFKIFHYKNPETKLKLIGDGPDYSLILQLIKVLNLDNAVQVIGWLSQSDLRDEISSCKAVIVPSLWQEPFGLVAAEAMALAKPVVYSLEGALPEVLGPDGECGIGFKNGDIMRIVAALSKLHDEPLEALRMGLNGRQRVENFFAFPRMVDQYEALYESLQVDNAI